MEVFLLAIPINKKSKSIGECCAFIITQPPCTCKGRKLEKLSLVNLWWLRTAKTRPPFLFVILVLQNFVILFGPNWVFLQYYTDPLKRLVVFVSGNEQTK